MSTHGQAFLLPTAYRALTALQISADRLPRVQPFVRAQALLPVRRRVRRGESTRVWPHLSVCGCCYGAAGASIVKRRVPFREAIMVRRVPSGIAARLTPVAFRYRRIPGSWLLLVYLIGLGIAQPAAAQQIAAPSDTTALSISDSRVDVSWRDNSSKEDGFELFRSASGAN